MSRFDYYGDESDTPAELWHANVKRALAGKRGQRALAELEQALLAMPNKRLLSGALSEGGEVCAVGALGAYRAVKAGKTWEEAVADLPYIETDVDTAEYGKGELGLTFTLAWTIAERNDERFGHLPPEQIHARMLQWVRSELATTASPDTTEV